MNGHEQRDHKSALRDLESSVTTAFEAHQERVGEQIRTLTTMLDQQTSLITRLREDLVTVREESETRLLDVQAHIQDNIDRLTMRTTVLDLPFLGRLRWLLRGQTRRLAGDRGWPPLVRPLPPPPPAPPRR